MNYMRQASWIRFTAAPRGVSEARLQDVRFCVEEANAVLRHLYNQPERRSSRRYRCLFSEDGVRAPHEDPENKKVETCRPLLASGVKVFSRLSQSQLRLRQVRKAFPIYIAPSARTSGPVDPCLTGDQVLRKPPASSAVQSTEIARSTPRASDCCAV